MNVPVVRAQTHDALREWGSAIARYRDLEPFLSAARERGPVHGLRFEVSGRHTTEDAGDQRLAIAAALRSTLGEVTDRKMFALLCEREWRPESPVHRRIGIKRLIRSVSERFGVAGPMIDASFLQDERGIRAAAVLQVHPMSLDAALGALEQEQIALSLAHTADDSADRLAHDLFATEDGRIEAVPLWPLWVARRADAGELVTLAEEFNDHTGRQALLLGGPQAMLRVESQ